MDLGLILNWVTFAILSIISMDLFVHLVMLKKSQSEAERLERKLEHLKRSNFELSDDNSKLKWRNKKLHKNLKAWYLMRLEQQYRLLTKED